jgi:hypothetical protein
MTSKTAGAIDNDPKFNPDVILGTRNRQVGLHPALLYASYLDPRFKDFLFLNDDEKDEEGKEVYFKATY